MRSWVKVRAFRWNPFRWDRRARVIAATASAAVTALAVSLVLVFAGDPPPAKPVQPPPRQARLFSPFTGEPVTAPGPVLAVKIDNIAAARPPTGLTSADLVYVLPVEGGLSRILAVLSSRLPPVIGPVRSAREDDLEVLAQFGRPAFAYSGATPHLLPFVQRARTVDLYAGRAGGYFRDPRRPAPHNLYARTQQTKVRTSRFLEAGSRPPYAESTGSGTAVVLRDGRAYDARWSRPDRDGDTAFTTTSGQPMTFARGPVWIVLAST